MIRGTRRRDGAGDRRQRAALCSFCGKSQRQVKKLIAGPGVYICDECIDLCNEIIDEELTARRISTSTRCPARRRSTRASTTMPWSRRTRRSGRSRWPSTTTTSAFRWGSSRRTTSSSRSRTSLLLGPTGCGKTHLANTRAHPQRPLRDRRRDGADRGRVRREDVENILLKLIQAADFDIKKAETGIIYIDEVDKIARKADNPSITRCVRRGSAAGAPEDPRGDGGIGAAAGRPQAPAPGVSLHRHDERPLHLRRLVRRPREDHRRRAGKNAVGFGAKIHSKHSAESAELLGDVMPEDLLAYGLIPEFIGRLPVVSHVHQLSAKTSSRSSPSRRTRSSSSISASSRTTRSSSCSRTTRCGRSPTTRSSGRPGCPACARSSRARCST